MNLDLKSNLEYQSSLAPASRTTAVDGTGVAVANRAGALVVIDAGASGGTTPSFTFQVEESDDDSTYTAVADADLDGTEPVITTANDNSVTLIGYRGTAPFLRVAITTVSGASATLLCSAGIILGGARKKPV